jgi:hypothetical protein
MNINHPNERKPDPKSAVLSNAVTRWVAVLIGLAMLCVSTTSGKGAEVLKEYELKAAFLYNFTKFIEWPTNSFAEANAPFVVAVAGNSPCTAELQKIAKERKVNGRALIIKLVKTPEAAKGAHVLFVSVSEDARLKEWLAAAHSAGVLSIGESEPFFKQGGIINFILEGEKIRFDLNIGQANATELKISAQLQKLARTIRKKS